MNILVINPGSTSTKISVYENDSEIFTKSVFHDADVLEKYNNINDQIPFRKEVVLQMLNDNGINIEDIDAFVGRGGGAYSQKEGVTIIDEYLYADTLKGVDGSDHPAKLGVLIAYDFGTKYGKPMYTMNPTNLDELTDVARITGIEGVYRSPSSHALNQKAVARYYCEQNSLEYEDVNLIVAHIDGGITIGAHHHGKMIDCNVGSGGDGPFAPTRVGSVPIRSLIDYLKKHSLSEVEQMLSKTGGFVSFFGTSKAETVREMMNKGDKKATIVWHAMVYNIAKQIGAMSAVLKGDVKQIILTGGYIRFNDLVEEIKDYCGYIAPITIIKDREQETLALEAYKVLTNKNKAIVYERKPVFNKFDFDE
ncbi:MAG: butyrate kinase [Erysipelotrichaceae bacterium]|nr:butyrate kinase [Erysipelotrichaceae bacterium]